MESVRARRRQSPNILRRWFLFIKLPRQITSFLPGRGLKKGKIGRKSANEDGSLSGMQIITCCLWFHLLDFTIIVSRGRL